MYSRFWPALVNMMIMGSKNRSMLGGFVCGLIFGWFAVFFGLFMAKKDTYTIHINNLGASSNGSYDTYQEFEDVTNK